MALPYSTEEIAESSACGNNEHTALPVRDAPIELSDCKCADQEAETHW